MAANAWFIAMDPVSTCPALDHQAASATLTAHDANRDNVQTAECCQATGLNGSTWKRGKRSPHSTSSRSASTHAWMATSAATCSCEQADT